MKRRSVISSGSKVTRSFRARAIKIARGLKGNLLLLIDVDCKLFPMGKCKHGDTCLFKHATPTLNIDRVTVETFYRPQPQPPPPSLNDALHRNEGSSFPSSLLIFRCFLRNQPLLKLSVLTCRSSVSIFNGNNDMHEPRNVPCPWFPFPFFTI